MNGDPEDSEDSEEDLFDSKGSGDVPLSNTREYSILEKIKLELEFPYSNYNSEWYNLSCSDCYKLSCSYSYHYSTRWYNSCCQMSAHLSMRLRINFTLLLPIITAPKRSLGQGNIFSRVCQEFCSQGGVPGQVPPTSRYTPRGRYTPWQVHPLGWYTPQAGTPLLDRYTTQQVHPPQVHPPAGTTPPGRYTPWEQCMLGDTSTSGRYASYWNAFLLLFGSYSVENTMS